MTLPRFLVPSESLGGVRVVLAGATFRHLRARRLRVGSVLILTDGRGGQRRGTVTTMDRHHALVTLGEDETPRSESTLHLTLAQGALKGSKLDAVIEKATELGVSEIVVFTSACTIARLATTRQARWARIAQSAAQQSQRSTVPCVLGPIPLRDVVARTDEALRLLLWEHERRNTLDMVFHRHPQVSAALIVVGPEGGFSAVEVDAAARAGFEIVGLSGRILRADTAALAAVTLCQYLWGDLAGQHAK